MFGKKTFGRKTPSPAEARAALENPTPDSDGVTRVFSKQLWDDPKIGPMLREIGLGPDDPKNRVKTGQDYIDHFATRRKALEERQAAFNRDKAAQFGHCNARPMLVIGPSIWEGEHGAFLYGNLDLCGFDEWNVLMCAADQETIDKVGLVGHPGEIPALTQKMTEKIVELKGVHARALDSFGQTAMGGQGIDRAEYEDIVDTIKADLMRYVDFCRGKVIEIVSGWK